MRFLLTLILFTLLINTATAQDAVESGFGAEEPGAFQLNDDSLRPGQAPVNDPRLSGGKETGGIILPQENSDLPLEAAIVFDDKKKKSPVSKEFVLGFISGSALISFAAFFMLKFAKRGV